MAKKQKISDKLKCGGFRTMTGISPDESVKTLLQAGVSVVGANYNNLIVNMIGVVKEIRSVNDIIPVLIHDNAGLPVYCESETVLPESPEEMASRVKANAESGTNLIGSCCGTSPVFIKKVPEMVDSF